MVRQVSDKQLIRDVKTAQEENSLNTGAFPVKAERAGDHLCLGCRIVDDTLILSTRVIENDHLPALYAIIRERANQVGVDLEED